MSIQRGIYMKRLRGFTLSELMIAITVLGVLCAITLPMMMNNNPNQNKMMMKKAYYTITDVVSDLINDPLLYPEVGSDGTEYVGFDNKESVTVSGTTYSGATKFAELFAQKLNLDGSVVDSCPVGDIADGTLSRDCRSFKTQDGMEWEITETIKHLTGGKRYYFRNIYVDINGDKAPNCIQEDDSCSTRTSNFDKFYVEVSDNGQITIPDSQTWFADAIQVSSSLTGD